MRRFRFPVIIGCACSVLGWVVFWLIAADGSPFSSYTHTREWPDDYWLAFNIVPVFLATRISPEHTVIKPIVGIVLASLWWFALGFVLSLLVTRFTVRRNDAA